MGLPRCNYSLFWPYFGGSDGVEQIPKSQLLNVLDVSFGIRPLIMLNYFVPRLLFTYSLLRCYVYQTDTHNEMHTICTQLRIYTYFQGNIILESGRRTRKGIKQFCSIRLEALFNCLKDVGDSSLLSLNKGLTTSFYYVFMVQLRTGKSLSAVGQLIHHIGFPVLSVSYLK